jgi:A/G-specific adenine glycosylase
VYLKPNCGICVLTIVVALQKKKVDQLPVKSKKLKVAYFNLVVDDEMKIPIQKRTAKEFAKFI